LKLKALGSDQNADILCLELENVDASWNLTFSKQEDDQKSKDSFKAAVQEHDCLAR
jgi:hypothetical protein